MVQRLQTSEYLKRYDNMTADECQAYDERVGEWLEDSAPVLEARTADFGTRLQNVLQASAGWNDRECQAFEEGARLLSALASTEETWLPDMLYVKAAKRVIDKVIVVLREHRDPTLPGSRKPKENPAEGTATVTQGVGQGSRTPGSAEGPRKADVRMAAGAAKEAPLQDGSPAPVRPKHIDQYVHLLPLKTQERAAQVKDLLRGLEDAREKMRLLMDDPTAKADDREAWAKKATGIDNKIRRIYDELDSEWAKLVESGRVVVDDLGNARVVEVKDGETGDDEPEAAVLTSEQKARRRELRKWLVDTRRGNGDSREEHVAKWKEGFKEFLSFDGEAAFGDAKILEAAAHYGIDMTELGMKKPEQPAEAGQTAGEEKPAEEEEKPAEKEKPAARKTTKKTKQ